jgi:hypothetical protein
MKLDLEELLKSTDEWWFKNLFGRFQHLLGRFRRIGPTLVDALVHLRLQNRLKSMTASFETWKDRGKRSKPGSISTAVVASSDARCYDQISFQSI